MKAKGTAKAKAAGKSAAVRKPSKAALKRAKWGRWRDAIAERMGEALRALPGEVRAEVAVVVAGAVAGLLELLAREAATAAARASHDAITDALKGLGETTPEGASETEADGEAEAEGGGDE